MPCKGAIAKGRRVYNLSEADNEKWQLFRTYCKQDVEVERAIRRRLEQFPIPDCEWELWALDQWNNEKN